MKTELHVTYEQAKDLRKLGFDWETFYYYDEKGTFKLGESLNTNWNKTPNLFSAPTTAQVRSWLYKTFGFTIITTINNVWEGADSTGWYYIIKRVTFFPSGHPFILERCNKKGGFISPEDAELEAISVCIDEYFVK